MTLHDVYWQLVNWQSWFAKGKNSVINCQMVSNSSRVRETLKAGSVVSLDSSTCDYLVCKWQKVSQDPCQMTSKKGLPASFQIQHVIFYQHICQQELNVICHNNKLRQRLSPTWSNSPGQLKAIKLKKKKHFEIVFVSF